MFQRRDTHKLPPDLLTNFKKSFPRTAWDTFTLTQDLLASPERTISTTTETEVIMNFNPNQYVNQEDNIEHGVSTDHVGDWSTPDMFTNQGPELFSFFNDMQPPFQHTPVSSSYGHHPHFMGGSVQLHDQPHSIPTPQSVTAPNSAAVFGNAPYVNAQGQHLHGMPQAFQQSFQHYHQMPGQSGPHLEYSQNPAFITPGRLDLSDKNTFEGMGGRLQESNDQLRFRVTLMTGTAMVKEGELPVTYLNKCQPYRVTIKDTKPEHYAYGMVTYRTFIRVSFNEQQQRERAAHCWQLWKDGRGITEAQQRGTKPFAVEYVPQNQSQQHISSIAVQQEVFDGFCFHWTPASGRTPECEIHLRCNFLSTDFSHSKGVKGIPVRLCAKTEILSVSQRDHIPSPEICFCKVKLFRDHGAERKLSNDEAHIRKSVVKLEEQIRQAQADHEESVLTSSGKRRRSDSFNLGNRPNKMSRMKRTTSVSSESSNDLRDSIDGDLQMKLAVLNQTLRSKREVSVLFLRGDERDDPDEYPVTLPESADQPPDSPADPSPSRRNTLFSVQSSGGSPPITATSIGTTGRNFMNPQSQSTLSDWKPAIKPEADLDLSSTNPQHLASPPDRTPKAETRPKPETNVSKRSIEVRDLDPTYVPPIEERPKAIACFYVKFSMNRDLAPEPFHRAVYLHERSKLAFIEALTLKQHISPSHVAEAVMVRKQLSSGSDNARIEVEVDDEVVDDIAEGQDMQAEFLPLSAHLESTDRDMGQNQYKLKIIFSEAQRSQSYD